ELDSLSDRLAAGLKDLGITKGDRVVLSLPNTPEFIISYYGIMKAGAIVVSANPLFKEFELEFQLKDSGANTIIANESTYQVVRNIQGKVNLKNEIVVGAKSYPGTLPFMELIERHPPHPPLVEINPKQDIAAIQYTGGTTGIPKGAMMSHYNLVSNAIMNAIWFSWTKEEKVMGVNPLSHTWGLCTTVNSPFYVGATLFLMLRFDPEKVLQTVDKHKITAFYGVTTLFNMLINHPSIGDYDLSSLRCAKAGAMPIPEEVKRKWDKITGTQLILGYGLTEASPETHNSPPDRIKVGSIGIPIMDTDAKIVDVETGTKELAPGEVGELAVKGPQVMLGYWQRPEETRETLRDGWLYTGDIARMDEEGYFYIVDRSKDMIKYKGYGVYPGEVENVLYMHPAIKECAVVGKPDAEAGEIPKAYVVLKDRHSLSEDELIEFCKQRVSPYKRIREVQFITEVPKTPVGKVLRRVLRDKERGQ
ncbi:long-chain fatty acid--CoA ligase, partial [Chloroflexota bacterium]